MSLTAAMQTARSSLSTLQERTSVISRNIANASNDYSSRKIAHTSASQGGTVRLTSITRVTDAALFQNVLAANASVGQKETSVGILDQLDLSVGDPEQESSPAALIGKLAQSLQQFSAAPQDSVRGKAVLDSASDLVNALNSATQTVQSARLSTDADIRRSVDNLNGLLSQVETVNRELVKDTRSGKDVSDQLDMRDQLLLDISSEIGIRVVGRPNNDIAIYTDSGVTLFDNTAREVSFESALAYSPGDSGNPIVIDGVRVTGSTASMPIGSGRLKGLTDARDSYATTYQSQLDEIARGLIEAFAETDQSGASLPDATGLFSYSGSPAVPASGTIFPGLAGEITINPAVDPDQGGNLNLLRDGGINGADYNYNASGASAFTGRILSLSDSIFATRSFDSAAAAGNQENLAEYSSSSVGWLQEQRRDVTADLEFNTILQDRSVEALSQVTGTNLDFEMTLLLDIERSYQATSKLVATIDSMYDALIAIA